jgi:quercetin dioxygenase-like cupin family protein
MDESAAGIFAGRLEDLPVILAEDHGGTEKRVVFGPDRFWEDHVVRFFTTAEGERSPFHAHDWPHYVLILEGTADGMIMGKVYGLSAGSWAYVPPNTEHYFQNTGKGPLKFICIVPKEGDLYWLDQKGSC